MSTPAGTPLAEAMGASARWAIRCCCAGWLLFPPTIIPALGPFGHVAGGCVLLRFCAAAVWGFSLGGAGDQFAVGLSALPRRTPVADLLSDFAAMMLAVMTVGCLLWVVARATENSSLAGIDALPGGCLPGAACVFLPGSAGSLLGDRVCPGVEQGQGVAAGLEGARRGAAGLRHAAAIGLLPAAARNRGRVWPRELCGYQPLGARRGTARSADDRRGVVPALLARWPARSWPSANGWA